MLQLAVLLLPFLRNVFYITPLTGAEWIVVVILGLMPLVINEIIKVVKRAAQSEPGILYFHPSDTSRS